MTDFKFMNSPLEADFALGNLDRWLTRAKADIKTTVNAAKDIASKKAWTDPKKNASYTDLGKGASEAKQRANKALSDKNAANKAAEREKTAKDTTLKYVEPRKPRAIAACFSGDLPDYLLFLDTALFESLEALQKHQQELYLWRKGVSLQAFI